MSLLLDTHALLWWFYGDPRLSETARLAIADEDNTVLVSAASAWEIATKSRIGKLPNARELAENLAFHLRTQQFDHLPITLDHAQQAGLLESSHRDPFDRMLIAQSLAENLILVSNETLFDQFKVRRLW
ncbi:MAG: type II toxin-antitoxin system VapC family toxin [Magnetococcales bacterium]|nr:type II toxin-antitoxin system VapC family toxin [Magnetococcales bacterium]